MTTSSALHSSYTLPKTNDTGSEPADDISTYYEDFEAPSEGSKQLESTSSSVSATSSTTLQPKVMQSDNSSDSEHAGAQSSETSSSMGESAAAAARVLAALQDHSSAQAASADGSPATWSAHVPGTLQSSSSTPRHSSAAAFSQRQTMREGSAPVGGSAENTGAPRTSMGFLALLNTAAAYVAEGSGVSAAQPVEGSYLNHNELLSSGQLTLSGLQSGFSQVTPGEEQAYATQYSQQLPAHTVQHLAQALEQIAATTAGTEEDMAMVDAYAPGTRASAIASSSGSAVRPELIMTTEESSRDNAAGMTASAADSASGSSKRKRHDAVQPPPSKRKPSQPFERERSVIPGSAEARRAARKWTDEETENLLQGCSKYGVGAWKKILDDPSFSFNNRTSVDLKDRFRTIRAQELAHNAGPRNKGRSGKEPDVVWPLPPNSERLQGLQRVQRKPTRNYSRDEDRRLLLGVLRHANHWTKIAADPDLQLGDRPGQSLRDRLRNAFPTVFELFGYVIPKKERIDRERNTTPGPSGGPKKKAPTGSKRLDGQVPENIRSKIMEILAEMNASLDPQPIPEHDVD
ncbi:hypothetical protein FBU59_000979, partial [Linderina macrospora]